MVALMASELGSLHGWLGVVPWRAGFGRTVQGT